MAIIKNAWMLVLFFAQGVCATELATVSCNVSVFHAGGNSLVSFAEAGISEANVKILKQIAKEFTVGKEVDDSEVSGELGTIQLGWSMDDHGNWTKDSSYIASLSKIYRASLRVSPERGAFAIESESAPVVIHFSGPFDRACLFEYLRTRYEAQQKKTEEQKAK